MITLQYQLLNDNHLMITFYIYKKNPWWVFVVTFTGRNHEIVCRILFVIVGEGEEDDGSGVAGTSQRSLPQSSQVQVAGRTHLQSLLLHCDYILKGDFNWRKKRLFEKTFSILKRCNSDWWTTTRCKCVSVGRSNRGWSFISFLSEALKCIIYYYCS
jgi:hypothetical protein